MKRLFFFYTTLIWISFNCCQLYAGIYTFEDNFDQGNLDNWDIVYSSYPTSIASTSNPPFDYHFTASSVVVDDIYSTTPYPTSNVLLSQITLSHELSEEIYDYTITLTFSWTMSSIQDGQQIFLRALTSDGYHKIGMGDMYTNTLGTYGNSDFNGTHSASLGNVTQLTGSASVTITREDGLLSAFWGTTLVNSVQETDPSPLTSINIDMLNLIKYYTHEGLSFGSLDIDSITFQGETIDAIPEPATFISCFMGIVSLISLRSRKKCN